MRVPVLVGRRCVEWTTLDRRGAHLDAVARRVSLCLADSLHLNRDGVNGTKQLRELVIGGRCGCQRR